MIKNSEKSEMAKIAVGKSLLKEYKGGSNERVVYMDNNTEFQVHLYNNQKEDVGVKVYINNKPLSHLLILRPAERCWLERYTDKAVKFKFITYKIDGSEESKELTAENGIVRVEFYHKKENCGPIHVYKNSWWDDGGYFNRLEGFNTSCTDGNINYTYYSSSYSSCSDDSVITTSSKVIDKLLGCSIGDSSSITANLDSDINLAETGRIEEGSKSNQSFETTYVEFEYSPFHTELIKILPTSTKPVHVGDLQKLYCPECGRKLNNKYKFCPYCGTKIEE